MKKMQHITCYFTKMLVAQIHQLSQKNGISNSCMRCSSTNKWGIYSHFALGSGFLLEKSSKSEGVIIDSELSAMLKAAGKVGGTHNLSIFW